MLIVHAKANRRSISIFISIHSMSIISHKTTVHCRPCGRKPVNLFPLNGGSFFVGAAKDRVLQGVYC